MNVVPIRATQDHLLTKAQLAAHLGCSTRSIENKMREGMPKLPIDRFGRRRYNLREVEAWLEAPDRKRKPVDRLSQLEARVASLEAQLGRTG